MCHPCFRTGFAWCILTGLIVAIVSCTTPPPSSPYVSWEAYGGDATHSQYSSLDQINKTNVGRLEPAWIYHTEDHSTEGRSQIQFSPIVVDDVLYGASPRFKLFALNASNGEEQWVFDPTAQYDVEGKYGLSRGVAYWEKGGDKRLLFGADHFLYAVNASNGEPVSSFGDNGRIDLRDGLDHDMSGKYWRLNTPGVVYNDLYIIGGSVAENLPSAPGHIRAYDIRTGERVWIFHTIPHPGEHGYETWPEEAWMHIGGANNWAGMSLDKERGIVYVPTGSAAFDFWGGNRPGENLFANSIIALDAETGERIWHFQTVKHDIWDRDLPAPPNLLTLTRGDQPIDALAQISKSGHIYVFDRVTGEPLFPMEEFDVPPSDLEGEETWPTQSLPTMPAPFSKQLLTADDMSTINPAYAELLRDSLSRLRSAGQFIPPSEQGTIIYPGFDGGGEWGGAAHDPNTGIMYVNGNEMAWVMQMEKMEEPEEEQTVSTGASKYRTYCANCHGDDLQGAADFPGLADIAERKSEEESVAVIKAGGNRMPAFPFLADDEIDGIIEYLYATGEGITQARSDRQWGVRYRFLGYNRFYDPEGYPAVEPPWGTLNAIDLNTGEYLWTVPLGEYEELTARGIEKTGTENYGGPVATAGGLVFIGASKDEHFRAFDTETGEELWKTKLPAGGYATPITYEVEGRQYVVIAAGGGKMGTPSGDAYVAFALP